MKNKIISILFNKCPRCNKGDFFCKSNPYKNFLFYGARINKSCSFCKQEYELEPGFFWGSMYVNYALSVFFGILTFLISYFVFSIKSVLSIIFIISFNLLILIPISYYLGRLIWINFFIKFKK